MFDGDGEIFTNHCEIYGQTSLEIDFCFFFLNRAGNRNMFKCNLFW